MKQRNSCGIVVAPLVLVFLLKCLSGLGDEIEFTFAHSENDNTLLKVYLVGCSHIIITLCCSIDRVSFVEYWSKQKEREEKW